MKKINLTSEERAMIQALRNQKAQQGAEDTHSNEGGNTNSKSKEEKPKRTYRQDPFLLAARASMVKFRALPLNLQSTDTKWACVMSVLGSRHIDVGRFAIWILDNAQLLLHTYDFIDVCADCKRDPQAVAENLVLEGKSVCNSIRLNGLASYSGNILMFEKRLIPKEYRFDKAAEIELDEVEGSDRNEEGANA